MVVWKFNGLYKADAEKVAGEIESLPSREPQDIVDYARNENTELHKCFQWDDSIAANEYRKQQARDIVCKLVYIPDEKPNEEPKEIKLRVFQSVDNHYEPVKHFLTHADEYQKLLEQAKRELRAFKERYKMLVELEEIFALID